jgi:hypothetical protein
MRGNGGVVGKRCDFDWRVECSAGKGISRQEDNDSERAKEF